MAEGSVRESEMSQTINDSMAGGADLEDINLEDKEDGDQYEPNGLNAH